MYRPIINSQFNCYINTRIYTSTALEAMELNAKQSMPGVEQVHYTDDC